MAKGRFTKKFRKECLVGGRWYPAGQGDERYVEEFTLREFRRDNAHDEDALALIADLTTLAVGEQYVHDGGASGVDRFTRVQ